MPGQMPFGFNAMQSFMPYNNDNDLMYKISTLEQKITNLEKKVSELETKVNNNNNNNYKYSYDTSMHMM